MVSSRAWEASPTSSCSSNSDSWERQQPHKAEADDNKGHDRNGAERLLVDDERELARRVLEDLEDLYFDDDSDNESEDGDEYNSSSEWGSETLSCSRAGGRSAGGMTLEELTVAVNAAIEYRRPPKLTTVEDPVEQLLYKMDEHSFPRSDEHHSRSRPHHQRKDASMERSHRGESVFEDFQEMLERKEQHFYAMKASYAAEEEEAQLKQVREPTKSAIATVNQLQQTTAFVRDQATETEDFLSYPKLDASFIIAEFETPPPSAPPSVNNGYDSAPNELFERASVGPTLADLVNCRRRLKRVPSRSFAASGSSWSSSSSLPSSSAVMAPTLRRLQSSYASERGSSSSSSSACSSKVSSHSRASSKLSQISSKHSRREVQTSHEPRKSSSIDTAQPNDWQRTLPGCNQIDDDLQAPALSAVPDPPQVPNSPGLVKWELDLSNFTP